MQEYVRQYQATIEEYITTIPIYELCTGAERLQETSRLMRWWDQDHRRAEGANGVSREEADEVE